MRISDVSSDVCSSDLSVCIAESSGELVNAIAFFHDKDTHSPLAAVLSSAGMLIFLVVIKDAAFNGVRGYISATLHRRWRGWLNSRFNEALLSDSHTHFHRSEERRVGKQCDSTC